MSGYQTPHLRVEVASLVQGKTPATHLARKEADVTSQPNKLAKNQVWQMKQMFGKNLAHITKAKQVCN